MRAMVIGGSGMFGRKTIKHMLEDKDYTSVVSVDLAPPKDWFMKEIEAYKDKFHFVRGDVSQFEDLIAAMKAFPVDGLVNWAFLMREAQTMPRLAAKINALGMNNAFEAARLMGVNRVVYASSETVYGPQDKYGDREVKEDDQLYPNGSYGICKRFAEIQADQYVSLYGMKFNRRSPDHRLRPWRLFTRAILVRYAYRGSYREAVLNGNGRDEPFFPGSCRRPRRIYQDSR